MGGWKTWLAASVSMLYGIGGWVAGLHDTEAMMGFVVAALGLVGLGHKIDRASKQ